MRARSRRQEKDSSMSNILVINASGQETRVALIEQGTISEYYLERKNEKGIVGNIYKGRVVRVLPGMQAAFVDIGLDKAAFLYVGDIVSDPSFPGFSEEMDIKAGSVEGDPLEAEDLPEPSEESLPQAAEPPAEVAPAEAAAAATSSDSSASVAQLAAGGSEPAAPSAGEPQSDLPVAVEQPDGPPAAVAAERLEPERSAATPPTASGGVQPEPGPASAQTTDAVPAETAAGAQTAEPAEVLELHPEDILEDEDGDDLDVEDDELDEADAAHAAAEEAMAAEQAGREPSQLDANAQPGSPATAPEPAPGATPQPGEAGARGLPADQRPAPREGRRGRRRGGRGRRRGGEGGPRPAGEQPKPERRTEAKPWQGPPERRADKRNGNGHKRAQIQDLLKEGDEVLVQAVKDPIGTKGARITCHISLPGRHLVFMPTVDHVGISRRIENEKERRRLRDLVDRYRPPGTGFIVRTVAENEPSEKLTADIKFLLGLWNEVGKKRESMKAPACVHPDLDLILRSIRDLFSDDVEKLVIDDRAEYERTRAFVEQAAPELKERIELYGGEEPIFDEYGIEQELIRAQNRKVWLKSGGYIIIDQTEALVAIDVNSGRYVGKKGAGASLEDTITKINCEAAKEIVYQLRLRNIGGIIIIDFIDMDKGGNREKVFKTLQDALAADRAKTNVLKISDIGLVEMTRKRVRESIGRLTTESCPTCDGRGHVRSKVTMAYDIMREVQRAAGKHREDLLVVSCHPEVAKLLQGPEREAMRLLMMKLNKSITVRPQPQYHVEQYDLHAKWSRPDLEKTQRGGGRRDGARRDGNRNQQPRPTQPEPAVEPAAVKVSD
jgi:Rne/Rng family ribonuclease